MADSDRIGRARSTIDGWSLRSYVRTGTAQREEPGSQRFEEPRDPRHVFGPGDPGEVVVARAGDGVEVLRGRRQLEQALAKTERDDLVDVAVDEELRARDRADAGSGIEAHAGQGLQ